MSFSNQIKKALIIAEFSQTELSKKTGLSKSSISQFVSGKNIPSKESLEKIANALECSSECLCMEADENVDTRNVSIANAAKRLDKSEQFIRVGLQTQRLPFGVAVKMPGGKWSYHVSPKLLNEYIGKEDGE